MRRRGKINQKMPHQVVMTKGLHSVEHRTYGVEYATQSDIEDKLPRGVIQKEREEKYHGPAHNKIYGKAHSRYGATAERLVKHTEDNHRPLQDEDQPPLPAADDRQCHGGVAARNGYIYKYMVQNVEYLLVARVVQHRVIERRDEEHHKDRDTEDADAKAGQHITTVLKTPHRRKRQSKKHNDAHHTVRDGIAHLLTKCRDINLCHKRNKISLLLTLT